MTQTIDKARQLRNTTTIRWTDDQMKIIADTAWERRTSVSEMIREMVSDALSKEGIQI